MGEGNRYTQTMCAMLIVLQYVDFFFLIPREGQGPLSLGICIFEVNSAMRRYLLGIYIFG